MQHILSKLSRKKMQKNSKVEENTKGLSSGDAPSSCWHRVLVPRPGAGIHHPHWSSTMPFLELQGFPCHQLFIETAAIQLLLLAGHAQGREGNLSAAWQSLWVSALSHLQDDKEVSTNLFSDIVPAQPWPRAGPLSCSVFLLLPAGTCSSSAALGQLPPQPSAQQDTLVAAG